MNKTLLAVSLALGFSSPSLAQTAELEQSADNLVQITAPVAQSKEPAVQDTTAQSKTPAVQVKEHSAEDFQRYVTALKAEAAQQGIAQSVIDSAFANVKYHPKAVKADRNQPESKRTLAQYLERALPDWKVAQARRYYDQNYAVLKKIGDEYGVQPRFIVALWGVESSFGKLQGNYDVIDALTTLAYDGRREAFFRKEVMSALQILNAGHIPLSEFKGSWAGAMGQCQFMPSSYLSFARDGNGDGKIDIWQTKADVFASTANYLKQAGWNDEYTWGRTVKLPANFDQALIGRSKAQGKNLVEWQALGVRNQYGGDLPALTDLTGWVIQPDGKGTQAYLVYGNYQALMDWNRSNYFALSVSLLANKIKYR
ncbi:Tn3 family transposase TnXax1 [Vibrio stylophorae]|uniref:Tn3 family transposase TnXax1 n=1 Tax=Vibrio stylophorae TaxID=659351 RepID=A0ABN8DU19_9VIBR|nr:lytic murein transglycosylase [Vibrio stylophorae]CAH0533305.1 Tn3 family transposase TnXax1 [Vibrio stylophorae]